MKKIFTLIFALLAVIAANAEETTIWEKTYVNNANWSDACQDLAWGNYDWSKVEAGTTLRLYATPNSSSAQITVKHANSWADIPGVTTYLSVTADKPYYDFELTADGIADIASNNGLVICGYDFTMTKVTLVTAVNYFLNTIAEYDPAFATGEWVDGFSIAKEKFADCHEGDILEFFKTDAATDYTQVKTQIENSAAEVYLEGNKGDLNAWNCATITGKPNYRITLTANDVENLKAYGLRVSGRCINISKVNLLSTTEWPTAVANVSAATKANGACYNIAGQRVSSNAKGLVIMNGKTFVK